MTAKMSYTHEGKTNPKLLQKNQVPDICHTSDCIGGKIQCGQLHLEQQTHTHVHTCTHLKFNS